MTEAVATALGSGLLSLGDDRGALCDPYYPKHARLDDAESATVLEWHRFALRCRDLFRTGEDTSWIDVGDENGALVVECDRAAASPEPIAGGLFVRVVRTGSATAISCLDLSGSHSGSWATPTAKGEVRKVRLKLLVEAPERCHAAIAALGTEGGRFMQAELVPTDHREGRAVALDLPIGRGWSVARLEEST